MQNAHRATGRRIRPCPKRWRDRATCVIESHTRSRRRPKPIGSFWQSTRSSGPAIASAARVANHYVARPGLLISCVGTRPRFAKRPSAGRPARPRTQVILGSFRSEPRSGKAFTRTPSAHLIPLLPAAARAAGAAAITSAYEAAANPAKAPGAVAALPSAARREARQLFLRRSARRRTAIR